MNILSGRGHKRLNPEEIHLAQELFIHRLSTTDIARYFGVTPTAINYHCKNLSQKSIKDILITIQQLQEAA